MMDDIQIPSKIIVVGTSKMSLHDRFSRIVPVQRLEPAVVKTQKTLRKGVASKKFAPVAVAKQRSRIQNRESLIYEQDDDMYEEEEEYDGVDDDNIVEEYVEEYVPIPLSQHQPNQRSSNVRIQRMGRMNHHQPRRAGFRQFHQPTRPVHIFDRLSLPAIPPAVVTKVRPAYSRIHRGTNSGIRRGNQNQQQNRSQLNGVHNRAISKNIRGGVNGGQYNRGGFSNRRGGGVMLNKRSNVPKKTSAELDAELDAYMKRSKHKPITM